MKRKIFYMIGVLLIVLSGCGIGEFAAHYVGPYNRPNNPPYYKSHDKWVGHKNYDIENPTEYQMETYCSICHYIYLK